MRRLEFVQRAAQRFKLAFVGELLVLGQLDQPQHFHHLLQRLFQRLDNLPDLSNSLSDGGTLRLCGARNGNRGGNFSGNRRLDSLLRRRGAHRHFLAQADWRLNLFCR